MRLLYWGLSLLLFTLACTRKARASKEIEQPLDIPLLDEVKAGDTLLIPRRAKLYQGSYPMRWQLIHTELSLSLDWARQEIPGEAQLTLRPYFTPQSELVLDAKAFQIEEVRLLRPAAGQIRGYRYDSLKLYISLDRPYTSQETVVVYVKYRARPEKIGEGGSTAISGRKGGYFINPDGKRPCVPRQFWTQGEPEAASAWFPTIDAPNQKTTQRLCVTIEDSLVSLSNGLLVSQKKLPGGLRQDCWELGQPHAPYLFALIVGNFQVIKDSWRGKEVSYYMEPSWAPHAKAIFGRTPQMLEFFSNRLGVEFPWPKYSQVIVRDFVSGAMENTTAVVHGDMLFYDKGRALTNNHEEVIAHELFHHWFGDLVTCESWAQLPLNESFADYAEYLWLEHAEGIERAELHRRQALSSYLAEAARKKVPLIRFDYGDPMNMFDAHSYQKGGLTLHLLRNLVGDSAFFLSLRQYLLDNAYKATDIDHLRHAFEKVTGEDWTWFFDQHFRRADEVSLFIHGEQKGDSVILTLQQRGYDTLRGPYRYLLSIALSSAGGYEELPLEIVGDTVIRLVRAGLRFADVDPKRLFIGSVTREYPLSWWQNMVSDGRYFLQRTEALSELRPYLSGDSEILSRVIATYRQGGPLWKVGIWESLGFLIDSEAVVHTIPLVREAIQDKDPGVRAAAWEFLVNMLSQEFFSPAEWREAAINALSDSSSRVQSYALGALFRIDTAAAVAQARRWLTSPSEDIFSLSAFLLIARQDTQAAAALISRYPCLATLEVRAEVPELLLLIYQKIPSKKEEAWRLIQYIAREENPWYLRLQMVQLLKFRAEQTSEVTKFLKKLKEEETHPQLRPIYQRLL
ncbi:MAG: M1 family metallopeptidase [Bacteroidia bacterium]|nr:M1 family metallopeptidase [Bacteroidia bacterium]MDW8057118.1 M1 family metallopeptidase [Bacteroidia bacterium]